jgi:hypothetical protein
MENFEEKYKRWHQRISYAKSFVRLVGCVAALVVLPNVAVSVAVLAGTFAIAELLGIAEEWI